MASPCKYRSVEKFPSSFPRPANLYQHAMGHLQFWRPLGARAERRKHQMLSRSNKFVKVTAILFIASLTLQFVRPRLTNPPVTAELQAPPEVLQVFKTSCYNCHSNETHLSWFDEPVPAYWLAAMDVMQARKHLNFSEIGKLPPAQQRATLFAALSQINLGAMPLPSYRRLHPESNVTPEN